MSSRDLVVYRSSQPDVLAHWHKAADARIRWGGQMTAFLTEQGLGNRAIWSDDVTGAFGGIEYDGDDVPDGWRVAQRTGRLVPRLATKVGKAIDARLDALPKPDPRAFMPGMPGQCFVSLALLTCGLEIINGALYATWSLPIPEGEVDPAIWEPVKLSAYYAVLEARDDASMAGGDDA